MDLSHGAGMLRVYKVKVIQSAKRIKQKEM
jgi:hypothetical protein